MELIMMFPCARKLGQPGLHGGGGQGNRQKFSFCLNMWKFCYCISQGTVFTRALQLLSQNNECRLYMDGRNEVMVAGVGSEACL